MDPSQIDPDLYPFLLLGGGVLFSILLPLLTAWLSGWSALARQFRAADFVGPLEQIGDPVQSPEGLLLLTRPRRLQVTLEPCRQGLLLSADFFHRPGRPPLLVPWDEVHRADGLADPGHSALAFGPECALSLTVNRGFLLNVIRWKREYGSGVAVGRS